VKPPTDRPKAIARSGRRLALTWLDFLVIAATVLTFGAVLMANIPNGKATMRSSVQPSTDEPVEIGQLRNDSQLPNDPDLVRARIKLALGGPWS
jgi:hypothetical protein